MQAQNYGRRKICPRQSQNATSTKRQPDGRSQTGLKNKFPHRIDEPNGKSPALRDWVHLSGGDKLKLFKQP